MPHCVKSVNYRSPADELYTHLSIAAPRDVCGYTVFFVTDGSNDERGSGDDDAAIHE